MTLREDLADALASPNVGAFLRVIRAGESHASDDEAYRALYGWRLGNGVVFPSFDDHPRQFFNLADGRRTSAAGAYQATATTWGDFIKAVGPMDFSPASQDLFAVWCIRRRGALADVLAGRIEEAIVKCRDEWTSLPGAMESNTRMAKALERFEQWRQAPTGRAEAPDLEPAAPTPAPAPKGWTMAPILAALLPSLISAIPRLASIFKPGSEVAERNVKAVTAAFDIAKEALGAANEQEVVQRIQADPAAAQTVTQAIESRWIELTEAGGGGIAGARAADASATSRADFLHSPSFWIALAMLPLVYMIVANLIGILGSSTWSDDARAGLAGSIVGSIIGGLVGFYYGQTTSRNRTPA